MTPHVDQPAPAANAGEGHLPPGSEPLNGRALSRRGFLRATGVLAGLAVASGALAGGQPAIAGWGQPVVHPGQVVRGEYPEGTTDSFLVMTTGGEGLRLFAARGGRVIAADEVGRELWRSPVLDVNFLEGVHDLAGNGRRQLVLLARRNLLVLDADTGKVLWRFDAFPETPLGGHSIKEGILDPRRRGEQIAFFPTGSGSIIVFAFDHGVEAGYVVWRRSDDSGGSAMLPLIADVDGDGLAEMVLLGSRQTAVLEAGTGRPKPGVAQLLPRGGARDYTYASLPAGGRGRRAVGLALGGRDATYRAEWLAFGDQSSVAGASVERIDDVVAELETVPQPYLDLAGDGRPEVAYSLRYDRPDRRGWWIAVRSAETGALVQEIPGARLLAIADLDGDGVSELVLERDDLATSAVETPCPCAQKPGLSLVSQLATGALASTRTTSVLKLSSGVETRLGYYDLAQDLSRRNGLGETHGPEGGRERPWPVAADIDADGRPELIGVNRYTGKWTSLGLGPDGAAEMAELPGACQEGIRWAGVAGAKLRYLVEGADGLHWVGADGTPGAVMAAVSDS